MKHIRQDSRVHTGRDTDVHSFANSNSDQAAAVVIAQLRGKAQRGPAAGEDVAADEAEQGGEEGDVGV